MKSIKKVLAVLLAMIMAFGVVSASVFAEEELPEAEVTAIDYVNVTVEAPIAGYLAGGLALSESPTYEVVDLEWTDVETDEILYSTNEDVEFVEKNFELLFGKFHGQLYDSKQFLHCILLHQQIQQFLSCH